MIRTNSIRALIMSGLVNGLNTAEIGNLLQIHFPGSAAAEKVSKHVGFYRAEMVKAGTIAKGTGAMTGGARVTAPAVDTVESLEEKIAALQAQLRTVRPLDA
jgi:hypothetical protein